MEVDMRPDASCNCTSAKSTAAEQNPGIWDELGRIIGPVWSAGSEFGFWNDLTDVLNPECLELIRAFALEDKTRSLSLARLTAEFPSLKSMLASRAEKILEGCNAREILILIWRILADKPWKLHEVGKSLGITRERVRQIQKSIEDRISVGFGREPAVVADIVGKQLGPVVSEQNFRRTLHELGNEASAEGNLLIAHVLQDHLGYAAKAGVCFSPEAMRVVTDLQLQAQVLADEVNLVNEEELKASLTDSSWLQYWDLILDRCGFFKHFGILALRDSNRVRVKAALVAIGRPATRKEISRVCGLPENRISAYLSSFQSVVRAGIDSWGLVEWVDDVYNGIPAAIAQRIEEDGGATAVTKLLQELPAKFGVQENSVVSYINAPRFTVQNGFVSLADVLSFVYRPLDDVIDGRNDKGEPFWLFQVEERYFRGHSITGVPPEIARALGCGPGGRIRVSVANLPDTRDLSVIWNLSSTTGASIGYLSDSLLSLGAREVDRVRITIQTDGKVSLTVDESGSTVENDSDLLLERIKNRGLAI